MTEELFTVDADIAIPGLADLVNADSFLVHRGRFLNVDFLADFEETSYRVSIEQGRVIACEKDPLPMRSWAFAVRGSADAWRRFWQPMPEPGFHDIFAMVKRGAFRIEGDLLKLMQNLLYMKEVLAAPRRLAAPERAVKESEGKKTASTVIEPIVGRYLNMSVGGRICRIYFEEAGAGIPLVCLHTAGADGRQFRHLMLDAAVTDHFRVIAFDLPWHGKSNPPEGWHREEYRLTVDAYMETILSFCRALELDKPVVMGCSIGGRIVVKLAIDHATEFCALIGLEANDHHERWADHGWATHQPDIHGSEVSAGVVSGMIAPQSPETGRWESLWYYMQAGPGVFKGDLFPYDFRDELARFEGETCPVYLLTGEYDFTVPPEGTKSAAEQIPGAEVTIMTRLGHFPMSENPAHFRTFLLPVLERIVKGS